jgi:hypothetical protein
MSKPQWLKDKEANVQKVTRELDLCVGCIYFGKFVKMGKHRNKEIVEVHECDIHPNCLNTKYSIACDDFTHE